MTPSAPSHISHGEGAGHPKGQAGAGNRGAEAAPGQKEGRSSASGAGPRAHSPGSVLPGPHGPATQGPECSSPALFPLVKRSRSAIRPGPERRRRNRVGGQSPSVSRPCVGPAPGPLRGASRRCPVSRCRGGQRLTRRARRQVPDLRGRARAWGACTGGAPRFTWRPRSPHRSRTASSVPHR